MSLPGHAEMAHQAESFRLVSQMGMRTGSSQTTSELNCLGQVGRKLLQIAKGEDD